MKIFVTGGTGFIGKHLIDILTKKRHKVAVLTRKTNTKDLQNIVSIKGSLGNTKSWGKQLINFNPDVLVHLAWEGLPDHNFEISRKNLDYGLDLFELITKTDCKKIVSTGSGWEYGVQSGKLSENTTPIPFDAHTAAKHSLRMMGEEFAREYNMIFIWTRLFFVYGPGQRPKALIPYILSCLKSNQVPEIRNPDAENDFVYVEDVVNALYKLVVKSNRSGTYNIGSGRLTKVSDIINILYNELGIARIIKDGDKHPQDKIRSAYADISKIRKEVNWEPNVNIKEGILKTIALFE
jgi:nucleoside-diphosphate-sugar epimerase